MDSIKINGGSFKLATVLSYSSEDLFVEYYNRVLSTWLTEDKRKATLREIYKIAHDMKKYDNDTRGNAQKVSKYGRGSSDKDDNRADERPDNRQESRSIDAGNSF